MSDSDANLRWLTPNDARRSIVVCMEEKMPAFLWGPPGIGKSDLMQMIAQRGGASFEEEDDVLGPLGKCAVIDLRIATMEPTDIRGYPVPDLETGKMHWLPEGSLPLPTDDVVKNNDTVILFLDELNSAAPATQAATYQLTLNRRIGEYNLPDNVVVVAAGNREGDRGVSYSMPMPLRNRFTHFYMKAAYADWFQWAIANGIAPDIISFLDQNEHLLFQFDPTSPDDAFATPRTWANASRLTMRRDLSHSDWMNLMSGTVGEGIAVKFNTHRKYFGYLPHPREVLTGKVDKLKNEVSKEISAQYSLGISMCYLLKEEANKNDGKVNDEWHKMADTMFKFMLANFETELIVAITRLGLVDAKLPFSATKMKAFKDFFDRHGKLVTGAVTRARR